MSGGNQFGKVQPGQKRRASAAVHNAMLDCIDYVAALRASGGAGRPGPAPADATVRLVKNSSGLDVGRFGILGVSTILYSPTDNLAEYQNNAALVGVAPTDPAHLGKFAVMLEPVANGKVGLALLAGVVPVQLYVAEDNDIQWADIRNGTGQDSTTYLTLKRTGSAQILYRQTGTGTKWALVRLQAGRPSVRCSALFKGAASGTSVTLDNVVPLDGGRGPVDSAATELTAYNGAFSSAADNAPCVIVWNPNEALGFGPNGRWQIEPPAVLAFEMTAALSWGGTSAAIIPDAANDLYRVNVTDASARFSKMATTAGDLGAVGLATWNPAAARYDIATMQTPGDFWGTLTADLHRTGASATVAVAGAVLGGYSIFGTNHGANVTAYNPVSATASTYWHQAANGCRVFCRWDIRAAKYWILAAEPDTHDWQTLDVVTGATAAADISALTGTADLGTGVVTFGGSIAVNLTLTKKRILLPPWAAITDP